MEKWESLVGLIFLLMMWLIVMNDRRHDIAGSRVVLSAECGSFKTHDAHILRKGFLGIGRQKCEGYVHRHIFQLDPIRYTFMGQDLGRPFFLFTVNWKCHCGEAWSVGKTGFYRELLGLPATVSYSNSNGWDHFGMDVNYDD